MNYERPAALTGDVLRQRIFSPIAYAGVRRAQMVAIAASEATRYAGHFPVVWRKRAAGFELVVLRSLLPDGRGHATGTQKALGFLPALIRAYPFLYDPAREPTAGRGKLVDTAIADEPGDVGAPICLVDGRLSKASSQRIALLDAMVPAFVQTAAISSQLAQVDLFEPWVLQFDNVEGQTIDVAGLFVVKQVAIATGVFAPLLRVHGKVAADLIGLHRVSLFRAGILLAQARMALKLAANAPAPAAVPLSLDGLSPEQLATLGPVAPGADA